MECHLQAKGKETVIMRVLQWDCVCGGETRPNHTKYKAYTFIRLCNSFRIENITCLGVNLESCFPFHSKHKLMDNKLYSGFPKWQKPTFNQSAIIGTHIKHTPTQCGWETMLFDDD